MINQEIYAELKEHYSDTSSWTVWKEPGSKVKSNTGDMSIFEDENICAILNNKYVFVALNYSNTHGEQTKTPWKNFHSSYIYQNDYKLRYALLNSEFWGSYITDIIKDLPEVDSSKVMKQLKNNPQIIEKNIKRFKKELNTLSDKRPVLIALGNDSERILKENLENEYEIYKIKHYSAWINKENYKKEVLKILKDI